MRSRRTSAATIAATIGTWKASRVLEKVALRCGPAVVVAVFVGFIEKFAHFGVYGLCRFFRILFFVIIGHADIMPALGTLIISNRAELVAHAPFANHAARKLGSPFDILLGAA